MEAAGGYSKDDKRFQFIAKKDLNNEDKQTNAILAGDRIRVVKNESGTFKVEVYSTKNRADIMQKKCNVVFDELDYKSEDRTMKEKINRLGQHIMPSDEKLQPFYNTGELMRVMMRDIGKQGKTHRSAVIHVVMAKEDLEKRKNAIWQPSPMHAIATEVFYQDDKYDDKAVEDDGGLKTLALKGEQKMLRLMADRIELLNQTAIGDADKMHEDTFMLSKELIDLQSVDRFEVCTMDDAEAGKQANTLYVYGQKSIGDKTWIIQMGPAELKELEEILEKHKMMEADKVIAEYDGGIMAHPTIEDAFIRHGEYGDQTWPGKQLRMKHEGRMQEEYVCQRYSGGWNNHRYHLNGALLLMHPKGAFAKGDKGSQLVFEGQWQHGLRHGRGTLFAEDQSWRFTGLFFEDEPVGWGELTMLRASDDWVTYCGRMKDGEFLSKLSEEKKLETLSASMDFTCITGYDLFLLARQMAEHRTWESKEVACPKGHLVKCLGIDPIGLWKCDKGKRCLGGVGKGTNSSSGGHNQFHCPECHDYNLCELCFQAAPKYDKVEKTCSIPVVRDLKVPNEFQQKFLDAHGLGHCIVADFETRKKKITITVTLGGDSKPEELVSDGELKGTKKIIKAELKWDHLTGTIESLDKKFVGKFDYPEMWFTAFATRTEDTASHPVMFYGEHQGSIGETPAQREFKENASRRNCFYISDKYIADTEWRKMNAGGLRLRMEAEMYDVACTKGCGFRDEVQKVVEHEKTCNVDLAKVGDMVQLLSTDASVRAKFAEVKNLGCAYGYADGMEDMCGKEFEVLATKNSGGFTVVGIKSSKPCPTTTPPNCWYFPKEVVPKANLAKFSQSALWNEMVEGEVLESVDPNDGSSSYVLEIIGAHAGGDGGGFIPMHAEINKKDCNGMDWVSAQQSLGMPIDRNFTCGESGDCTTCMSPLMTLVQPDSVPDKNLKYGMDGIQCEMFLETEQPLKVGAAFTVADPLSVDDADGDGDTDFYAAEEKPWHMRDITCANITCTSCKTLVGFKILMADEKHKDLVGKLAFYLQDVDDDLYLQGDLDEAPGTYRDSYFKKSLDAATIKKLDPDPKAWHYGECFNCKTNFTLVQKYVPNFSTKDNALWPNNSIDEEGEAAWKNPYMKWYMKRGQGRTCCLFTDLHIHKGARVQVNSLEVPERNEDGTDFVLVRKTPESMFGVVIDEPSLSRGSVPILLDKKFGTKRRFKISFKDISVIGGSVVTEGAPEPLLPYYAIQSGLIGGGSLKVKDGSVKAHVFCRPLCCGNCGAVVGQRIIKSDKPRDEHKILWFHKSQGGTMPELSTNVDPPPISPGSLINDVEECWGQDRKEFLELRKEFEDLFPNEYQNQCMMAGVSVLLEAKHVWITDVIMKALKAGKIFLGGSSFFEIGIDIKGEGTVVPKQDVIDGIDAFSFNVCGAKLKDWIGKYEHDAAAEWFCAPEADRNAWRSIANRYNALANTERMGGKVGTPAGNLSMPARDEKELQKGMAAMKKMQAFNPISKADIGDNDKMAKALLGRQFVGRPFENPECGIHNWETNPSNEDVPDGKNRGGLNVPQYLRERFAEDAANQIGCLIKVKGAKSTAIRMDDGSIYDGSGQGLTICASMPSKASVAQQAAGAAGDDTEVVSFQYSGEIKGKAFFCKDPCTLTVKKNSDAVMTYIGAFNERGRHGNGEIMVAEKFKSEMGYSTFVGSFANGSMKEGKLSAGEECGHGGTPSLKKWYYKGKFDRTGRAASAEDSEWKMTVKKPAGATQQEKVRYRGTWKGDQPEEGILEWFGGGDGKELRHKFVGKFNRKGKFHDQIKDCMDENVPGPETRAESRFYRIDKEDQEPGPPGVKRTISVDFSGSTTAEVPGFCSLRVDDKAVGMSADGKMVASHGVLDGHELVDLMHNWIDHDWVGILVIDDDDVDVHSVPKLWGGKDFNTTSDYVSSMTAYIDSIPHGSIVLIGVCDQASTKIDEAGYESFKTCGGSGEKIGGRHSFVMIGRKGDSPGSANESFEAKRTTVSNTYEFDAPEVGVESSSLMISEDLMGDTQAGITGKTELAKNSTLDQKTTGEYYAGGFKDGRFHGWGMQIQLHEQVFYVYKGVHEAGLRECTAGGEFFFDDHRRKDIEPSGCCCRLESKLKPLQKPIRQRGCCKDSRKILTNEPFSDAHKSKELRKRHRYIKGTWTGDYPEAETNMEYQNEYKQHQYMKYEKNPKGNPDGVNHYQPTCMKGGGMKLSIKRPVSTAIGSGCCYFCGGIPLAGIFCICNVCTREPKSRPPAQQDTLMLYRLKALSEPWKVQFLPPSDALVLKVNATITDDEMYSENKRAKQEEILTGIPEHAYTRPSEDYLQKASELLRTPESFNWKPYLTEMDNFPVKLVFETGELVQIAGFAQLMETFRKLPQERLAKVTEEVWQGQMKKMAGRYFAIQEIDYEQERLKIEKRWFPFAAVIKDEVIPAIPIKEAPELFAYEVTYTGGINVTRELANPDDKSKKAVRVFNMGDQFEVVGEPIKLKDESGYFRVKLFDGTGYVTAGVDTDGKEWAGQTWCKKIVDEVPEPDKVYERVKMKTNFFGF